MISALSFDNMILINDETYKLIFMGMFSFAVGCVFPLILIRKNMDTTNNNMEVENYALLNLICVLIIIFCLYKNVKIIGFLSRGMSWWEIRLMHGIAGDGGIATLKGSNIEQVLHDFIVAPILYLITPTVLIDLSVGKRNKIFNVLAITAMILYSIASVSRAVWAFSIIYLAIILFVYYPEANLSPKIRKWIKRVPFFILVLFGIIMFLSKLRSGDKEVSIIYNVLAYLSGGIALFQIHLSQPYSLLRTDGFFSFYGFLHPFFFVLNYFKIFPYPNQITTVQDIKHQLEMFYQVSDHVSMNAYTTLFYNFYIDYGEIGIIVLSLIFGFICMLSYKMFVKYKDLKSFVIFLILTQFILFSMARIYTSLTTRALSLIWALILLPSFKKVKKNEISSKKLSL